MLPLPDTSQLQRLSAFDGDSAAAWRLHGAMLRELYGEVASALVLRPPAGAPRLVALTVADGAVRIDASDPFDISASALALGDGQTLPMLQAASPVRLDLASAAPASLLLRLLECPLACALPLHAGGRSELLLVLGCAPDHRLAAAPLELLSLLANCLAAYLRGALDRRVLAEETRRARSEIHDLADVQRLLLPDNPQIDGLEYAIHYQPAAVAGGDYYDLMRLSHRMPDHGAHPADAFGLMLADVSGHGAGAAMEAVQFDAILRTYTGGEGLGPAGALTYSNRHFFSRKARPHFMTVVAFVHAPQRGEALLCNAGHLPPLRRRDGRVESIDAGRDIPLGILREHRFENHVLDARSGDILLFCTDGITEARDPAGTQFGYERVQAILERTDLKTPTELLDAIVAQVHAHQGGPIGNDDQTLVVLRLA